MKTFSHIPAKDWDFDKYKFGLADTKVGGKNAQNAVKIKTFINDPKPFKYAFLACIMMLSQLFFNSISIK